MIQIVEKLLEKGKIYFSFATFAHLDEGSVFGIHIESYNEKGEY